MKNLPKWLRVGIVGAIIYSAVAECLAYFLNTIGGVGSGLFIGKVVLAFYYPGLVVMEMIAKILPPGEITGILLQPTLRFAVSLFSFLSGCFVFIVVIFWLGESIVKLARANRNSDL